MTAAAKAVNCNNCGGTLTLHGGHRVRSLTCSYCGAVMDCYDNFKVIDRYAENECMPTPLAIGMQATLKGVEFTIIGAIEYSAESIYRWVSFQLYSPTHGYVWLTYNKGHYVFSYRIRKLPTPVKPDPFWKPKAKLTACGRMMRFYEHYEAKITYVAGELTWIAKVGDTSHATDAIAPPYLFSYERSDSELEYSLGEYLDAELVHRAFAIEPPTTKPTNVHPAQPFHTGPLAQALFKTGQYFVVIALIALLITYIAGAGRLLVETTLTSPDKLQQELPFTVTNASQLLKLSLDTDLSNNWAYYDITVMQNEDEEDILYMDKEISYYWGTEDGESWTEGSRSGSFLFKLPEAGDYALVIEAEYPDQWTSLQVSIYENVWPLRYFVILLILAVLAVAVYKFRQWQFESKRWGAVMPDDENDENDENDDD